MRHWLEMEGGSGQIDDVESVVRLANHFGVSFWVARYRAKAAGLLTSPTRLREIDRELRRREWQTLPRQLFLGGLRDTLSVLSCETRPGQEQNQLRIAPQGVRVPGAMRAACVAPPRGRCCHTRGGASLAAHRRRRPALPALPVRR